MDFPQQGGLPEGTGAAPASSDGKDGASRSSYLATPSVESTPRQERAWGQAWEVPGETRREGGGRRGPGEGRGTPGAPRAPVKEERALPSHGGSRSWHRGRCWPGQNLPAASSGGWGGGSWGRGQKRSLKYGLEKAGGGRSVCAPAWACLAMVIRSQGHDRSLASGEEPGPCLGKAAAGPWYMEHLQGASSRARARHAALRARSTCSPSRLQAHLCTHTPVHTCSDSALVPRPPQAAGGAGGPAFRSPGSSLPQTPSQLPHRPCSKQPLPASRPPLAV